MNPCRRRFSFRRVAHSALALCVVGASPAIAGDSFTPAPAALDPGHCKSLGEGFYAVRGTDACVKISGYIAAGVEFTAPDRVGGATGSFAPRAAAGTDTRFDTELGPSRLYVQIGRDHVQP